MRALIVPDQGTPELITTETALLDCIDSLQRGDGPIAIDAERASGFRYFSSAYLIQLFRRSGGLHLIDPIAVGNSPLIVELNKVISSCETVIHASTQDLPCLREFGITPNHLFDTELAARIAGCERVGLGALCESLLEISLAKEHSAVDWSIRPLKQEWLDYAALDVAVLLDLRDKLYELLESQDKLNWVTQDFSAILSAPPSVPKSEPWRRTSGMHEIKSRYQMAIIRELWSKRNEIAEAIDLAPGRLLSDHVIVALAKSQIKDKAELLKLPEVKARVRNEVQKSYIDLWMDTYLAATKLKEIDWPQLRGKSDSLPPVKIWKLKYPLAHARLSHAKHDLAITAGQICLPLENLLTPEIARKICFDNGAENTYQLSETLLAKIQTQLRLNGAREWQIEKCATVLAHAMTQTEPVALPMQSDLVDTNPSLDTEVETEPIG
jgi:ribonuclease D